MWPYRGKGLHPRQLGGGSAAAGHRRLGCVLSCRRQTFSVAGFQQSGDECGASLGMLVEPRHFGDAEHFRYFALVRSRHGIDISFVNAANPGNSFSGAVFRQ